MGLEILSLIRVPRGSERDAPLKVDPRVIEKSIGD